MMNDMSEIYSKCLTVRQRWVKYGNMIQVKLQQAVKSIMGKPSVDLNDLQNPWQFNFLASLYNNKARYMANM